MESVNTAFPLRPRKNTNNEEVAFEGVEAMPVDEEVVEEQDPATEADAPDLVDDGPEEEAVEEDLASQECARPRILPDPGQPTQKQLEDHRVDPMR